MAGRFHGHQDTVDVVRRRHLAGHPDDLHPDVGAVDRVTLGATSLRTMAITSSSATRRGNNASSGAYPVAGASGGQPARRNATTLDT